MKNKFWSILTLTVLMFAFPAAASEPDTEKLLQSMTLEQKVGQLFVIRPDALDTTLTPDEINDRLLSAFQYDEYAWQKERGIRVRYPKRA